MGMVEGNDPGATADEAVLLIVVPIHSLDHTLQSTMAGW